MVIHIINLVIFQYNDEWLVLTLLATALKNGVERIIIKMVFNVQLYVKLAFLIIISNYLM